MRSAVEGLKEKTAVIPRCLHGLLAPLLALLLAATTLAQTSKVSGTLQGTVTDSSGAPLASVRVRLRNTATNLMRTVETDERGFFRANELAVGTYEVGVERSEFAPYLHTGVTLTVGTTIHLSIELAPATLRQQVTVSAQPPSISPSETTMTTTVDHERIEESPVRSRNYLDFVLLAPGVASADRQQTSGAQTPLIGSGFTFGGLRSRSNNLSIDGLDNNDEFTGSSRTELSPEIVREFQVVTNGLSAEFGGASGGSINVVTKTGSNVFHGDVFIFVQSGGLNARNPLEGETQRPHLRRYRAGSSIGGPIRRNKTFFYTAFEQESSRSESSSDIDSQSASAINRFLGKGAFQRLVTRGITTGFFPTSRAETEASGKLNHQISDQHSLMLRYAYTGNQEAGDAFNTGGFTDASSRGSSFTKDHGLVGSLVSLRGTKTVNDLRFQLAKRRLTLRTDDQTGPEIDINGLVNFGRPYQGNSRRRENHYEVSDTLAVTRGPHLFKAGLTVNRVSLDSSAPDGFGGVYIFPSLADFISGRPDSFLQAFGIPTTNFGVSSYGLFAEDHWSAGKQVTVDLGMRYDFEHLPAGFNQDRDNVSPRIGLAYSPSSIWVLRAGFGIFYDRYVLANLNRALEKNGTRSFMDMADGDMVTSIFQQADGGPLQAPISSITPSVFRADPRLTTSYSQQANFGIEYLLGKNLTVSANYLLVRGLKLARTRNINLLAPRVLTAQNSAELGVTKPSPQQFGREVFSPGRFNPRFDGIYQLEDSASSTYHGLSLTLNRRLASDVEFSANYTLSKTLDNSSDFDEQPQNPFDLRADRALSRNHQGQRFVFSGVFDLPFGEEEEAKPSQHAKAGAKLLDKLLAHVELAPIVTLASAMPVNPLTGADSNQGHAFPISSRPLGFSRNSLRAPGLATVDVRLVKYFPLGGIRRLDFVVESFNLFNRVNVREINPFFGSSATPISSFALPIEAFNGRQVQFSIDFEY